MTRDRIVQDLQGLLQEADPRTMAEVNLQKALDHNERLPLDSLASFELAKLIEEKFSIEVLDEEIDLMVHPVSLLGLITTKLQRGSHLTGRQSH